MQPPPDLFRLASEQLGLLARRQVVAALGEVTADRMLRSPWLERVQLGVVRFRGGAPHPCQAAVAASLRAGPGATLTGPAALDLLAVDGVTPGGRFEVLVPPGRRVGGVGFRTRRDPDPARGTWQLGLVRVAEPIDALIESCLLDPTPPARELRQIHDRLRWNGRLRQGSLQPRATQLARSGSAVLDDLLELDGQASTGDGERRLGRLLARF